MSGQVNTEDSKRNIPHFWSLAVPALDQQSKYFLLISLEVCKSANMFGLILAPAIVLRHIPLHHLGMFRNHHIGPDS